MSDKKSSNSLPVWYRTKFDLAGLGFGGLALLLAIIVGGIPFIGWILSIIFWIAVIGILFASRDSERTSPAGKSLVLSPCDGVISDIATVPPPREVRWDVHEVVRIRISSSPFSVNGIRSPITGNVESILEEEGAPAALATTADNSDLREAFFLVSGEDGVVGVRVATGGLGPRLDIDLEAGDGVRGGRKVGVRRLGGWCDVFLPLGSETTFEPGMTVVGGETIIADLATVDYEHRPFTPASAVVEPEGIPDEGEDAETVEEVQDASDDDSKVSEDTEKTEETSEKDDQKS